MYYFVRVIYKDNVYNKVIMAKHTRKSKLCKKSNRKKRLKRKSLYNKNKNLSRKKRRKALKKIYKKDLRFVTFSLSSLCI